MAGSSMRRTTIHYVNDPMGELSASVEVGKSVRYERVLKGFHAYYGSKHPKWGVGLEECALVTTAGGEVDLGEAPVTDSEVVMVTPRNGEARASRSRKRAEAAAAAFKTLELVEAYAKGDGLGRTWYLQEGVLERAAVEGALRRTEDAKPATARCRELINAYHLGSACADAGRHQDAAKALAKAATLAAYQVPPVDPVWERRIYSKWAAATLASAPPGDRWTEVAIHKAGVKRRAWNRWDQRPVESLHPGLTAQPLWDLSDDLIAPLRDQLGRLSAEISPTSLDVSHLSDGRLSLYPESWLGDELSPCIKRLSQVANDLFAHNPRVKAVYLDVLSAPHRAARCAPTNAYLRVELLLSPLSGSVLRVADLLVHNFHDAFAYDPSFEHELWFEGPGTRLALVLDILHPDLPSSSPPP